MAIKLTGSPEFDDFYRTYPRREAKLDALKAFNQVTEAGATSTDILAGTKRFADRCAKQRTERQFIPLPASWLRAGRWGDEEMIPYPEKNVTHRATERSDDNSRWQAWLLIRRQPIAQQAVEEGWAWNLKCAVLDGSIQGVSDINPLEFKLNHDRAEANELRGCGGSPLILADGRTARLRPQFIDKYVEGRRTLALREAQTAEEIAFSRA